MVGPPETRPPSQSILRVLGTHPVGLLLGGRLASGVGDGLFELAMYWIVYTATNSRAAVGVLGAVGGLGYLASLATGVFADRLNAKRTLIVTDLVRAALVCILLVWLHLTHARAPLALWLVSVFVLTLMGSLFRTARSVLWVHEVPDAVRREANGLMQSTSALAQLGGMGLAGTLLAYVGAVSALGADAIAFALSGLSLFFLRTRSFRKTIREVGTPHETGTLPGAARLGSGQETSAPSWLRSFREGQETVWGSPILRRSMALAVVLNFGGTTLEVLLAAWVKGVLHAPSTVYGLMGAFTLVGVLVSGLLFARFLTRWGLRACLLGSVLLMGAALVLFSRVPSVPADVACLGLFGAGSGLASACLTSTTQSIVPKSNMGRVGGTLQALSAAANPVGAALAGSVLAGVPLGDVFLGAGFLMLLAPLTWIGVGPLAVEHAADATVPG